MQFNWVNGFTITVKAGDGTVVLSANRQGLLSLARFFTDLAELPPGSHFHLDAFNALEEGSAEPIVEKTDFAQDSPSRGSST